MTVSQQPPQPEARSERAGSLLRVALWVAIGALIAAAIVCVVWVLVGPDNGLIGRAFLSILLLAAFAGAAILDAHLAPRRPAWFALTSMIVWVVILIVGALLIWMPEQYPGSGFGRFFSFVLIVGILQLAVLHVRLYTRAHARHVTAFTRTITIVTIVLVAVLSAMLVFALTFGEFLYLSDLYWRIVVAITILAAVGTALIPLVNALFAPKAPRAAAATAPGLLPWPTYVDGVTPLPALPDGSPDFQAYYTGHATYPQAAGHPGHPAAAPYPGAPAAQQPAPPQPAAAPMPPHPAPAPPAAQPAAEPGAPAQPALPYPAPPVPPQQPGAGYPPPPAPPH
jgi:hypothetical protein